MLVFQKTSNENKEEIMKNGFSLNAKYEVNEKRWGRGLYFAPDTDGVEDLGDAIIAAEIEERDIMRMTQSQMDETELKLLMTGDKLEDYVQALGFTGVELEMEDNSRVIVMYEPETIKLIGWKSTQVTTAE